jgi:hypothetical protein
MLGMMRPLFFQLAALTVVPVRVKPVTRVCVATHPTNLFCGTAVDTREPFAARSQQPPI